MPFNGVKNVLPTNRMISCANGTVTPGGQTADFENLSGIMISKGLNKSLCSTLRLAKDNAMISVVTGAGTYILKPDVKLAIKKSDVVCFASEINGLHRLTMDQFSSVAKMVKPSPK